MGYLERQAMSCVRTVASTLSSSLKATLRSPLSPKTWQSPNTLSNVTYCSSYSTICRQHEASIRAKKDSIRQHIRLLELSRRKLSSSSRQQHGHLDPPKPGEELHITFVDQQGEEHTFEVAKGDNLLDIAQANDLEMEGACGGSAACSTCHVIVEDSDAYDKLPEASDDENDMLDLAFGLTETSRLGCQVKMDKDADGLKVRLPAVTRNLQASDFKPKS